MTANRSQYDPYWESIGDDLKRLLDEAEEHGWAKMSCSRIQAKGKRASWSGGVRVANGQIRSGGDMAHMRSLGRKCRAAYG